jgi:putative endonuclease
LKKRLAEHNAGKSPHTSKFMPWELVVAVYFKDRAKADVFERYLKQGSGHAFANRHFW